MLRSVKRDTTVFLEYTVRDEYGAVLDSNRGGPPLVYTHGWGELIPGVERAVEGMRPGQERQITVAPEDGYGSRDPGAELEIPMELVPPAGREVGAQLTARVRDESRKVRVKEVRQESVVLDLNHPMAGRTLQIDVRVLRIERPR